jgi:hypothetical protein
MRRIAGPQDSLSSGVMIADEEKLWTLFLKISDFRTLAHLSAATSLEW